MNLEDRLRELLEDRNQQEAVTLAKAALKNDDVVDVTVDGNDVTVETRRFRGSHCLETTPDGYVEIDERGVYSCTCDGVELSFSTNRMCAEARERAMERLHERDEPARDPGSETAPDGRVQSGPLEVGTTTTAPADRAGSPGESPPTAASLDGTGNEGEVPTRDPPGEPGAGSSDEGDAESPGKPDAGSPGRNGADGGTATPPMVADGGGGDDGGDSRLDAWVRRVRRFLDRFP